MSGGPLEHWREYLIEATLLGLFMVSACAFGTLLEHPSSPVRQAIESGTLRRVIMGCLMGLTAIALIYSSAGKRSGAHMNPALTLTFFRLGRVAGRDVVGYTAAQFAGAILGVTIMAALLGSALGDPSVRYVATEPGPRGVAAAFAGELAITTFLMLVVLASNASQRFMRYTGVFAGMLVATYITVEAPLSGMSMNPARTFGSAFGAGSYTALWVYFTAPLLGLMLGGQLFLWLRGAERLPCAKYCHADGVRCIFCEYTGQRAPADTTHRPMRGPATRSRPAASLILRQSVRLERGDAEDVEGGCGHGRWLEPGCLYGRRRVGVAPAASREPQPRPFRPL